MPVPTPNITDRDLEILMDAYAYYLSTDDRTKGIKWVLGDPGMGRPSRVPFAYIAQATENVGWYTSDGRNGGFGGLAAGLDDWQIHIMILLCSEPHRYVDPVPAGPPDNSPFLPSNNGNTQLPYLEQPGWRSTMGMVQNIKKVMRTNSTLGGAASDTRIVESRYLLQDINNQVFRAARLTIATQQRRVRGE